MLTVRGLVDELGLELAAGEDGRGRADPLGAHHRAARPDALDVGRRAAADDRHPAGHRRAAPAQFVRRLVDHHLAGLGFGTGFEHDDLPGDLLERRSALGFPLFEVPYELPFIAITEKAFARLVNEQYEVLQRGIAIHKRLERLVLEERGLRRGGARPVRRDRRHGLCARGPRRDDGRRASSGGRCPPTRVERCAPRCAGAATGEGAGEFEPDHADIAGRSLVLPVSIRGRGAPQAWIVATLDSGGLGDFERLILQQAVTVVALELMRQRAMRDTERRLAGDVLAEALTGRLVEEELQMRLRPFGVGSTRRGDRVLERRRRRGRRRRPTSTASSSRRACPRSWRAASGCCARWWTPARARRRWRSPSRPARRSTREGGRLRAGASRSAPVGALRNSFLEARCALEAAAIANGSARRVASYRDLGALPADPVAAGRRGAAPLLRQRARPARGGERRVRRRADPLARDLHRAERPVGARRTRALLPPAHAALPDPAGRAAHRPRPLEGAGTGSSSGWR